MSQGGSTWDATADAVRHMENHRQTGTANGVLAVIGSNANGRHVSQDISRTSSGNTSNGFRDSNSAELQFRKSVTTDATESDYFARKSLGILYPNPLKRLTRKRARAPEEDSTSQPSAFSASGSKRLQSSRIPRHSPPAEFDEPPIGPPKNNAERLARIAAVKERLNRPIDLTPAPSRRRQSAPNDAIATSASDPLDANFASIYEAFDEAEKFYHETMHELRRSRTTSVANSSPPDAKHKGKHVPNGINKPATQKPKARPLPAFYGRVSRFVPRELYGKGVAALRASGYGKADMRIAAAASSASHHRAESVATEDDGEDEDENVYESGSMAENEEFEEYDSQDGGEDEDEMEWDENEFEDEDEAEDAYARPSQSRSGSGLGGKGGTSVEDAIEL